MIARLYKNILINSIFFCLIVHTVDANENDSIGTFDWGLSYTADAARNFYGGIKTGNAYMGLIKGSIQLNTHKIWYGGKFYFEVMNTHGGNLSGNYIGDYQVVSNIENGNYTFLEKLYFNQEFSWISVTAGLQDLNEEFCTSNYASALTNSSFGIHSTFPLNFGVPVYPKTALGLNLNFDLNKNFVLRAGIFDGHAGSLTDDPHNLDWSISVDDALLYIGEIEYLYKQNTILKAGSFYHTSDYVYPDDSTASRKGNYGFFLSADKLVFQNDNKNIGVFGQLAYFPSKVNFNPLYVGLGVHYSGITKKRKDDIFAAGLAFSRFYDESYEYDLELNYAIAINKHIILQPAFHYIVNPGGNTSNKDSFAGFLRFSLIK